MSGLFIYLPKYLYAVGIETIVWFVFIAISYLIFYFKNDGKYNIKEHIASFIFEFIAIGYCIYLGVTTIVYLMSIMVS